jgi:hypothetical protein
MISTVHSIESNENLDGVIAKEARVRQLPSSKRWIASSRISAAFASLVLASWIVLSLLNDSLFLREAIASSFIIGCSLFFNRSNFASNQLN